MVQAVDYEDMVEATKKPEDKEDKDKGIIHKINIAVAVVGKKKKDKKTLILKLDERGLIKCSFKEGGKIPACLNGRYTDIKSVMVDLNKYMAETEAAYKVDQEVQRPEPGKTFIPVTQ